MKKYIAAFITLTLLITALPMGSISAAPVADENIALGKPTFANYNREGYNTATVTDGNIDNEWAGPAGTDNVFVAVDLGEPYIITSVVLHNRKSEPTEHFRRNVSIEFSNTPDFAVVESVVAMGVTESPLGVPVEVKPLTKKPYRYVRALKTRNSTHIVNEIEVYGYLEDPSAVKIGTDVVGTKYEGPITLLRSLGLVDLKNDMDEIFDTESIITRGDAAKLIVNAFGAKTEPGGTLPFADVNPNNKNYSSIYDAYNLGYIFGDGNSSFRPNDYVTKTEFTFMLLRAIGYGETMSTIFQNNASKVIALANRIDLLDSLDSKDMSEPVTRGDMAIFFYNALLSSELKASSIIGDEVTYESGETLLKSKFGITLTEGVVEETTITKLNGDPKGSTSAVIVGGTDFTDLNGKLDSMLGCNVVVATHMDNPKNILFAWKTGVDESVFLPSNILDSTLSEIESNKIYAFDETGNRKRYELEDRFKVIKNGIAFPYYASRDLMVKYGGLQLLDNDADGLFEVVFIEAYTLHYIENAFSKDNEFTFIDSQGVRKTLDKDTLTVTYGDGSNAGVNKIKQDKVIKLYETPNSKHCRIQLYEPMVTGALQKTSTESVSVLGSDYTLSNIYKDAERNFDAVPGEIVSLFVDEHNEVLWIERDLDAINADWVIAFSQNVYLGQGLEEELAFRLFTINGAWVEAYVAKSVTVDGSRMSRSDFKDLVARTAAGRYIENLIRYKLDSTGQISHFDTTYESAYEEQRNDSFVPGAVVTSGIYTGNSHAFWDGHKMIAQAKEETPVFELPLVDGSTHPKTSAYDSYYKVIRFANKVTSHSTFSGSLASYMPDEDGYPACFTYTTSVSSAIAGSGALNSVTSADAPWLLVNEITKAVNPEGAVAYKVRGYQISLGNVGNAVEIYVDPGLNIIETGMLYQEEPGCLNAQALVNRGSVTALPNSDRYIKNISVLGVGDIIHYIGNSAQVTAVERIYDYDPSNVPVLGSAPLADAWYTCGENHSFYTGRYRFQMANLVKVSDEIITVETLSGNRETYPVAEFSKVYVCEADGRDVKVSEGKLQNYIGSNAKVTLYSYWGSPKAIFIHTYTE